MNSSGIFIVSARYRWSLWGLFPRLTCASIAPSERIQHCRKEKLFAPVSYSQPYAFIKNYLTFRIMHSSGHRSDDLSSSVNFQYALRPKVIRQLQQYEKLYLLCLFLYLSIYRPWLKITTLLFFGLVLRLGPESPTNQQRVHLIEHFCRFRNQEP